MFSRSSHLGRASRFLIVIFLLSIIVLLQYQYDATKTRSLPSSNSGVSPFMVKAIDMGFDPAVSSFLWATTMPEILDLFNGKTEYFNDLAFLNAVDPKMSYPYAFSVLTLPAVPKKNYPDGLSEAMVIGREGLQSADPDWRISYYMATNYFLNLKDTKNALIYYNIAAQSRSCSL